MKMRRAVPLLVTVAAFAILPLPSKAQLRASAGDSSGAAEAEVAPTKLPQTDLAYERPTQTMKLRNYLFDAFGPYPIMGASIAAGINQMKNAPPEWKQGTEGYGRRLGSSFAMAAVSTTTRYALAEALREDTLYYRCECKGLFPRLGHAVLSTFVSRRGGDGHRSLSFPALVAPYAGAMTAVYAWYPGRYDARDGFRIGNYSVLGYLAENVALEFFYRGPHSWRSRLHLNDRHGAQGPGSHP